MEKHTELTADDFLFGNLGTNDQNLNVFDKQEKGQDGIYRPKLEDAKDKKIGYVSKIRFLQNFQKDGTVGPSAIEKHVHYVNLTNEGLSGYYDCAKNLKDKCELCTLYWKLDKSKNVAEQEKKDLIKRSTKYYSYIMVIEDDQHPELVGKILLYSYGHTIKEKINSERNGEVTGTPCNVFHLQTGKDFKLIIKDKAGYQNYDSSAFLETSVIKLYDEKTKEFKKAPVDENGVISNPKVQAKIKEILLKRDVEVEDHKATEWTEEQVSKVAQIVSIISGNDMYEAEQSSKKGGTATTGTKANKTTSFADEDTSGASTDADAFFDLNS